MTPPKRKRNPDQKTRAWSSTWDASIQAPLTLNLRQFNAEPIPSLDFNFHTESGPPKPRHYYRPTTRTVPTFDSLFISSQTHALVFQASIALKHDVNYEGLYWLYKLGIRTIEYVYITPSPTLNLDYARVTIPFPASVPDTLNYPDFVVVRPTNDANRTTDEEDEEMKEMNIDEDQEIVSPEGKKAIPKIVAIYHAILDVSDTPNTNKTKRANLLKKLSTSTEAESSASAEAGGSSLPEAGGSPKAEYKKRPAAQGSSASAVAGGSSLPEAGGLPKRRAQKPKVATKKRGKSRGV
jgi:hypothetical protein